MNEVLKKRNHNRKVKLFLMLAMFCSLLLTGCIRDSDSESTIGLEDEDPGNTGWQPKVCTDTPESSENITISVSTSRVSGVAPLSVFFDATGTTGLTDNGFFSCNAAYMDATFAWNFDVNDI